MWRVLRKHNNYGTAFKDFKTKAEAERWIHSDDSEKDMEDGFWFEIQEVEE